MSAFVGDRYHRGLVFDSTTVLGAIPTYVKQEPYWNLSTLVSLLTDYLPTERILHTARTHRRERYYRWLAREHTLAIATTVQKIPKALGTAPTPAMIASLQQHLVALIGWAAGFEPSDDLVAEYLTAVDISIPYTPSSDGLIGQLRRILTRPITALPRLITEFVSPRSLDTATDEWSRRTYELGRSAEVYFLDGTSVDPRTFNTESRAVLARN
jgi:hypothetical protein